MERTKSLTYETCEEEPPVKYILIQCREYKDIRTDLEISNHLSTILEYSSENSHQLTLFLKITKLIDKIKKQNE